MKNVRPVRHCIISWGRREVRGHVRKTRSRGSPRVRFYRAALFLAFLLSPSLPGSVLAQSPVADLISGFKARGRAVTDLVLDSDGNLHIAWTLTESAVHDAGTLFYTRLDKSGTMSAESQVTKFGGAYNVRIDVDSRNRAILLYWQLKQIYLARFDEKGTMKTDLDRALTEEESDARFEYCRDESDNMYILGRGTLDYFWEIDPEGQVLVERRGRWFRQPTPGFVCSLVNPGTILIVWALPDQPGRPARTGTLRSMKFDIRSFSGSAPREVDLSKTAEAREPGIALAQPHLIGSGKDVLLLTSGSDSTSESFTYRVRFNAKGDPVRRWEMKRIYHLEASTPGQGRCAYRTGLLLSRRPGPHSLDLQGIGTDGNIYHMTGKISALKQ